MVTYTPTSQRENLLFETPFQRALDPNNRWIKLARLTPWDELAEVYRESLNQTKGRPSIDCRIIIGTLFVQHIENLADERVIPYIQENVYAQAFLGLAGLRVEPVFDASLLVTVRQRLGESGAKRLNDIFVQSARRLVGLDAPVATDPAAQNPDPDPGAGDGDSAEPPAGHEPPKILVNTESSQAQLTDRVPSPSAERGVEPDAEPDAEPSAEAKRRGTLILDATASPVNIAYPTDTGLLNESRLSLERLIDALYLSAPELWAKKPRTYRRRAHTEWLRFAKSRNKDKDQIKAQLKASLAYVKRDLATVNSMLDLLIAGGQSIVWKRTDWRRLRVVDEVYRQQCRMYEGKTVESAIRIVSVHQPHIRAIKRGKSCGRATEFGPKYNASVADGFAAIELASFNNVAEASDLPDAVERHRAKLGHYPALVLGDGAYFTRPNRKFLKGLSIEHNGVPLGPTKELTKAERARSRARHAERQAIEGKFGETKTRYGLARLSTRGPLAQLAQLSLGFLAANAQALLRMLPALAALWLVAVCQTYARAGVPKGRTWGLAGCNPRHG